MSRAHAHPCALSLRPDQRLPRRRGSACASAPDISRAPRACIRASRAGASASANASRASSSRRNVVGRRERASSSTPAAAWKAAMSLAKKPPARGRVGLPDRGHASAGVPGSRHVLPGAQPRQACSATGEPQERSHMRACIGRAISFCAQGSPFARGAADACASSRTRSCIGGHARGMPEYESVPHAHIKSAIILFF
jgi:hypothetical protein